MLDALVTDGSPRKDTGTRRSSAMSARALLTDPVNPVTGVFLQSMSLMEVLALGMRGPGEGTEA